MFLKNLDAECSLDIMLSSTFLYIFNLDHSYLYLSIVYESVSVCVLGYQGVLQPNGSSTPPCSPCPQGTYKSSLGNVPCDPCPSGRTTMGTGHTAARDCGKW